MSGNVCAVTPYYLLLLQNVSMIWVCAGDEIRQILQGVTEWIASMVDGSADPSMVDGSADPFGDVASAEKSGELSGITAHVADVIFQMAGTLEGLGANNDMNVEITYEMDLGVGH